MTELSLKTVCDLLGQRDIPGSVKELEKFRTRINELVKLNGEEWVRDNRQKLLSEWEYIVREGIIGK